MEEKNQEVNEVITKDEKINAQQTNEEVAGTSTPEKKSDVPPLLKQTKKNVKTKPVIDSLAQSAIKAFKEKLDLKNEEGITVISIYDFLLFLYTL